MVFPRNYPATPEIDQAVVSILQLSFCNTRVVIVILMYSEYYEDGVQQGHSCRYGSASQH